MAYLENTKLASSFISNAKSIFEVVLRYSDNLFASSILQFPYNNILSD